MFDEEEQELKSCLISIIDDKLEKLSIAKLLKIDDFIDELEDTDDFMER